MSVKSKAELREHYKKLRLKLDDNLKARADHSITDKVLSLDEYKNSDKLLVFISKEIEIDTSLIIADAFSRGKTVYAPRCDSGLNTMSFYAIDSLDDLELGHFGIYEPKPYCPKLEDFDNSICLVPALCYDKSGFRVGFGGGYYDRFLTRYTGVSVGVCYAECVAEILPKEDYDRPVDILITD